MSQQLLYTPALNTPLIEIVDIVFKALEDENSGIDFDTQNSFGETPLVLSTWNYDLTKEH